MAIKENVKALLEELPDGVELVGAAKGRTAREIGEAIDAGLKIVGENYIQETLLVQKSVNKDAEWHFIGHLQRNKVKKAVGIFDMVESLDSLRLAEEIDKRCREIGKVMPVLVEVNSGREEQKFGGMPKPATDRAIRVYLEALSQWMEVAKALGLLSQLPSRL